MDAHRGREPPEGRDSCRPTFQSAFPSGGRSAALPVHGKLSRVLGERFPDPHSTQAPCSPGAPSFFANNAQLLRYRCRNMRTSVGARVFRVDGGIFRPLVSAPVSIARPPGRRLAPMTEGYCVKCKTRKEISNGVEETMKNGRRAIKGRCSTCGTVMFKILGGKAASPAPEGPST